MDGRKNLIPMNKRSESEQRRIQSMGGKASGKARRARKTARECAEIFLSLPVADLDKWDQLAKDGVDPGDVDNMMLMVAGAVRAAQGGDVVALREVLRIIGEDGKAPAEEDGTGVIVIGERDADEE